MVYGLGLGSVWAILGDVDKSGPAADPSMETYTPPLDCDLYRDSECGEAVFRFFGTTAIFCHLSPNTNRGRPRHKRGRPHRRSP